MISATVALLCLCRLAQTSPTNLTGGLLKVPFNTTLSLFQSSTTITTVGVKAVMSIRAGLSQTWKNVLIDTGSAFLWVEGDNEQYIPGPFSHDMNAEFTAGYGTTNTGGIFDGGAATGNAYMDLVTVGEAVVASQIIGAATSIHFNAIEGDIDGVLGLGPRDSNQGQVSGYNTTPTFVENLASEGTIEKALFGLYIDPLGENGGSQGLGELSFGGIDQARISGEMTWVPQVAGYTDRYVFNVSTLTFGDNVVSNDTILATTDSSTPLIRIPEQQWFAILSNVPGASTYADPSSALRFCIIFKNTTAAALPDLVLGIGNMTVTIPPSSYIVPESLYSFLNITDSGVIHTWFYSAARSQAVLGEKFLENVYSAYDLENNLVGLANLAV
ncbi:acid protease [Amylocystis lapponica]|nr:acid protease [Amylocystis lapponica]